MASTKALNGVAHNIMDHSVSGLGFLMTHVLDYCAATSSRELQIDLLESNPLTHAPEPLRASASAKHEKFVEILGRAGFKTSDLRSAHLHFRVLEDPQRPTARFTCNCKLQTKDGKQFLSTMDSSNYWKPKNPPEEPFEKIRKLHQGG